MVGKININSGVDKIVNQKHKTEKEQINKILLGLSSEDSKLIQEAHKQ